MASVYQLDASKPFTPSSSSVGKSGHGAAFQCPHREWLKLAGLEMRLGRQDGRDARVRLTADDIDQGRGRALCQHDIELLTR